jgi:diaminopimelate decarboxylase
MGDKATLGDRVDELLINPDVIERVDIIDSSGKVQYTVPNSPTTQKSLQIYAYITSNESMIGPGEARTGLEKYGEELVIEADLNRGKHPSIDFLADIVEKDQKFHSHVVTPYSAKPIPEHVRKAMPEIAKKFGTPIHVYDEQGIRNTCKEFNSAFSWNKGFRNFFAVKACPNPSLLAIMKEHGFGADCSSAPELSLSLAVGMRGEDMMFTSNDTPDSEFQYARDIGAIINLDDITHIEAYKRATKRGLPKLICFRYAGEESEGNSIIGNSAERKYGLLRKQIFDAFEIAKAEGVERFGLHTMMASNERNPRTLLRQAEIMFKLAQDLKVQTGVDLEFINLGGGIGTPYKPWDRSVDLKELGEGIKNLYDKMKMIGPDGVYPGKIFFECGRVITGPHGLVLTEGRHIMQKHRKYIGVDMTMADLMRPGIYGAYHHVTPLGKETEEYDHIYDVSGSLCENCDKTAVQRFLPAGIKRKDLLAVHNTGAHGRAMCFNYNGKLRSGEVLVHPDGSFDMIRRHETEKDLNATLDFPGSKYAYLGRKKNG